MHIGTIQSQVKLQFLDAKWQKKKEDINHKDKSNMTQDERMLQSLQEQARDVRKQQSTSDIYNKLKSGGTLTAEEIAYLKENDPEALADYEKAQAEKKAYEKALKNCRTKEDVDRLKMNKLGNFATEAKNIANNPYIPKDKKLQLMNKLNNEVCLIRDAQMEFEKSKTYENLPKEAEIAEERAKENAAENDELLAEQMEASADSKDVTDENKQEAFAEADNDNIDKSDIDSVKSELEVNQKDVDSKNLSFDRIGQDIERYIRKNNGKSAGFSVSV